jgi:hypothetical protein
MNDDEFQAFITRTGDELGQKQESLKATYGLGHYKDFWFDQPTGVLQFKDGSGKAQVEATVTPIGSFSSKSNTWQWAWANKSIVERLRLKAEKLKELSTLTGIKTFGLPACNADEAMAWEMTAMAVSLLGSLGCYRIPARDLQVFVAIDSIRRLA